MQHPCRRAAAKVLPRLRRAPVARQRALDLAEGGSGARQDLGGTTPTEAPVPQVHLVRVRVGVRLRVRLRLRLKLRLRLRVRRREVGAGRHGAPVGGRARLPRRRWPELVQLGAPAGPSQGAGLVAG